MGPYLFNGQVTDPGIDVVAFYADQFPEDDLTRDVSRRFRVPLYDSIDQALCLGGSSLAVDAVLIIGEHGNYPVNELEQTEYPRKRFFDQAVAVMQRSGRFVPIFNDKHLSYRWDWAKEMYDTSRRLGIPLMAGSSVPLAERRPPLEIPAGKKIGSALVVHSGGLESYGFHGLEVLQSMIETRRGGETGISSVQVLSGDKVAAAVQDGRIPEDLFGAAMLAEVSQPGDRVPRSIQARQSLDTASHVILVTYRDGTRGCVVRYGFGSGRWNFACQIEGEQRPRATTFYPGPWGNRNLFSALSHAIQQFFITRRQPYPVERTLLVSGALDSAMRSHHQGDIPIATPQLEFGYEPIDFRAMRETGGSWKVITSQTPERMTFDPGAK